MPRPGSGRKFRRQSLAVAAAQAAVLLGRVGVATAIASPRRDRRQDLLPGVAQYRVVEPAVAASALHVGGQRFCRKQRYEVQGEIPRLLDLGAAPVVPAFRAEERTGLALALPGLRSPNNQDAFPFVGVRIRLRMPGRSLPWRGLVSPISPGQRVSTRRNIINRR